MKDVAAVILAGGKGKRMGKLCHHRPKPALPFAGIYRVIDFALSNCLNSRIGRVALLTDYQRSYMASYLRQWHKDNLSNDSFEMDILEAKDHYLGTADALYQNLAYLSKMHVNTVLVLAADHVYKMDYRRLLSFHKESEAEVTVGVVPMSPEKARRFGTVTVGDHNRILDFEEKADLPQSNLVSMGIYVFDVTAITKRLSDDANDPDSAHDFGYSIVPGMVKHNRAFAYRFDDYWRDIGTTEAYYETSMEFACQQAIFNLNGTWPIATVRKRVTTPNVSPESGVYNSIVSHGCIIKGCVENSVISPGVWIAEHAVVRNSVLMDNVFIGQHSRVESSIIDEGASVGRSCSIGTANAGPLIPEDVIILEKDMVLPSYTRIGQNEVSLLPDYMSRYMETFPVTELSGTLTSQ
jgi:glucose-1-phosphate adenylyltransferase